MLSNHIIQETLEGLGEIVKTGFAIFDLEGSVLASTIDNSIDYSPTVTEFINSPAQNQSAFGLQFQKIYDDQQVRYILLSKDDSTDLINTRIAAFQIQELIVAYRERYDRDSFIKNLLLDNLLLVDVYNRSKRLGLDMDASRVAIIVEIENSKEGDEIYAIRELFPEKKGDFVTTLEENNVIIVTTLPKDFDADYIKERVKEILNVFPENQRNGIRISYGSAVSEVREVSRSYKEASMAMDVGKIFFRDEQIVAYSMLGIGRLIYQLPIQLCRMFIHEIFPHKLPSDFDEETITTINKFFENSLNVSETSRQLYIHRNTLVYRLDKIQKNTGLDLRVFEDAITFKIALMVVEYMKYMEEAI